MPFGGLELVVILVIVLIVFGAGKLPQVFGALGKGVREFRDASEGNGDTTSTTTTTTSTAVPPVAPPVAAPPAVPPAQPAATQYVPPAGDTTQKTG